MKSQEQAKNDTRQIRCRKCDAMNPATNEVCDFCKCPLDNDLYDDDSYDDSYAFHYIVSFIVPLVAFIVGSIMLASDDRDKRSYGKTCIVIGLLSSIISAIILYVCLYK